MKKILLLGLTVLLANKTYSQAMGSKENVIELHGIGLANSSWIFNQNVSNEGPLMDYAAGWSFNYGIGGSMYFGKIGFAVEGLFGNHKGAYTGTYSAAMGGKKYTSEINLSIIQIPVLFKVKNESGTYLEVGPQFNFISDAQYTNSSNSVDYAYDATKDFASNYVSMVLGFGFQTQLGESPIAILSGFRFQYSVTDLKGVDALANSFDDVTVYASPKTTAAATGGFMLGLVYTIGL